jgi:hypothetical protein
VAYGPLPLTWSTAFVPLPPQRCAPLQPPTHVACMTVGSTGHTTSEGVGSELGEERARPRERLIHRPLLFHSC